MAKMADYRAYLPSRWHEEFDAFLELYREHGFVLGDRKNLAVQMDRETLDPWLRDVIDAGRLDGTSDPARRLYRMDVEGIAAEVLFPDFGLPFQLAPPQAEAALGYSRSHEQAEAGRRAHNRWLVDFCSSAPERFVGQAILSFQDVDSAIQEIRWAKEAGLQGVVLPAFDESLPLYDPRHDPIWRTLAELELPVNTHSGITSTTTRVIPNNREAAPHVACAFTMFGEESFFRNHQVMTQMIWGGVLERHPNLKVIFTEQGSGWVVAWLKANDYKYDGSLLSHDLHEVMPHKPSEYFQRQVFLGSSIFSRSEIEDRHLIGLDKMMLGMDYPHIEGTWGTDAGGTRAYLQATLGRAEVPVAEAEMLLSGNVAKRFKFDLEKLERVRRRIGPSMSAILTSPTEDRFPRGDVNKPSGMGGR